MAVEEYFQKSKKSEPKLPTHHMIAGRSQIVLVASLGNLAMVGLISVEKFNNFTGVRDFPPADINDQVLETVRSLDEREEIEPYLRSILFDTNNTPHGPAEISDILTHKVSVDRKTGICAFILKGKSFPVIRPKHVAHQIYRLEKIADLSFSVLAYTNTILDQAQEQFISTSARLKLDYAIFDTNDLARIFVAYGFICPRDGRHIVAGRCPCGYSPSNRFMNILQKEALKSIADARELKQPAGLVILPPGSGKTRLAAEDAKKVDASRILYVAHTHEILDVAKSEFDAVFTVDEVRLHDGPESLNKLARVNIATIQLLDRNAEKLDADSITYLIIDEFHHAAARSYRNLLARLRPTFMLGLTATPFRGDRQDILALCGNNVLCQFDLRFGIDAGILTPYHYYGCFDDIDYSIIKHNGVQYHTKDLEKALIIPERDQAIIAKWRELADGLPTLAFCASQNHAHRVKESFESQCIPASVYLGATTMDERRRIQEQLRCGEIKVVCTVDVLNEGADIPFVECLLFLRPTESKRIFFQQLGRGLRKAIGKAKCVAIDFIGDFENAYRIIEYQALLDDFEPATTLNRILNGKEILNLPLGCSVSFDDRVLDLFQQQQLSDNSITRHNIARILLLQYKKLWRLLKRRPTRREVDQNLLFSSELYKSVFGSWRRFQELVENEI